MHWAGYKIRAWRDAHNPPLSAEEFGIQFGDPWPSRTVYGWESKGKVARPPVQRRLADLGICSPEDWLEPAPEQDTEDSSVVSQNDQFDRDTRDHPFFDLRQHGMVRVATSTPRTRTADIDYNVEGILAEAERALQARLVDELMRQGVGFADPARVDIRGTLSCGKDVFIDINADEPDVARMEPTDRADHAAWCGCGPHLAAPTGVK